ncbi:MAG TPA: hypothetical protein VGD24_08980, partial [Gallionella sp.]
MAVVASAQEAEVELEEHASSKGKGAAKGALAGAECLRFGILALIVCPISIPIGAVVGSAMTPDDTGQSGTKPNTLEDELTRSQIEQSRKLARKSNQETVARIQRDIQESFRNQVISVALAKGEDLVAVTDDSARLASRQR